MSTMPPEQPSGGSSRSAYGYNAPNVARMPIPGNAEFLLYAVIEIVFVLIWIIADSVNTLTWVTMTTALTFGYIISRGIAKAGKNDCASTGNNSCGGSSKVSADPKAWVYVPEGYCDRIVNASKTPK